MAYCYNGPGRVRSGSPIPRPLGQEIWRAVCTSECPCFRALSVSALMKTLIGHQYCVLQPMNYRSKQTLCLWIQISFTITPHQNLIRWFGFITCKYLLNCLNKVQYWNPRLHFEPNETHILLHRLGSKWNDMLMDRIHRCCILPCI